MSRRAAARRYEISESVAIKWLERVERDGSREPERDAQTAADLARAQQLAEEARQLMRALFRPPGTPDHRRRGGRVRTSTSRDLALGVDCWLNAAGTLIRVSAGNRAFLSQRFFAGTRFLRVMLIEMRSVFAF